MTSSTGISRGGRKPSKDRIDGTGPITMTDEPKITVLPPGIAKGAGDLQRWAGRRLAGRSGVPEPKNRHKRKRHKAHRWTAREQEELALDQAARRAADAEKVRWTNPRPAPDERVVIELAAPLTRLTLPNERAAAWALSVLSQLGVAVRAAEPARQAAPDAPDDSPPWDAA